MAGSVRVGFGCLSLVLACGFASRCQAIGDGFFELSLSVESQFVVVEAVDLDTLLTLPTNFTADSHGLYNVEALLVANGDTANPIGGFRLTGDLGGSLRVAVEFDSVPLGGAVSPSNAFLSIISGVDVAPFAAGGPEMVQTGQTTTTTGTPGTPPAELLASSRAFMATADGKEAFVPGVSGTVPIPGMDDLVTGFQCLPPLPPDTVESEFSGIVMQQDLVLFDLVTDTDYTITSAATTSLSRADFSLLPGDYNNDGAVNAADYTVWRDNLGAPAGTLPNDFTGLQIGVDQFIQWSDHFGDMVPVGAHSEGHATPEPASSLLLWLALPLLFRPPYDRRSF